MMWRTAKKSGFTKSFVAAAVIAGAGALFAAPLLAENSARKTTLQETAAAGPAMWRLADENNTVWIFGSVHYLTPGVPWRRQALDAALSDAEIVFFEIAFDPRTVANYQRSLAEKGYNPPGVRLSEMLTDYGRARLKDYIRLYNLDRDIIDRMKPWNALFAIDYAAAEVKGASVDLGVDNIIEAAARSAGKEVRSLETVDQFVNLVASIPLDKQLLILEGSMVAAERFPRANEEILAAWLVGDIVTHNQLRNEVAAMLPPIFDRRLLTDRNRNWAEQLDTFMDGDQDALVIVGADHTVGDESLIALMRARGYRVVRY